MITSTRTAARLMIIARPNCSASWRSNLLVLLALAVPSLGAATGFALRGAWPILPLAGLELLALGSALYYVNWKLQYRHVITLSDDSVCIDKGFYAPTQSWQFPRQSTGLAIIPERHPWEGPELSLQGTGESVSIGEFLNRDDSLELAALLRREIRVGSHSARGDRLF
ncbi:MAG: DUF2244 domain-containing protein [Halioglobus sp.]|nr:DUF2244 domain-containing protein [Halioglobus sp.]MCB1709628.1 DUF2244 domain-containing protein [Halioglobus sp.]MCP5122487.1 DUF2244 domain-containing protein [Pseudomonadales bacterium]MCP5191654.1 DUF2244 domain-containing protein [Pseudomonadales bacterium]